MSAVYDNRGMVVKETGVGEWSADGRFHGVDEPRGLGAVARSALYDGFFGRMFRHLPPLEPSDEQLERLAETMVDTGDTAGDSRIPAGYTYLGQFIDHDLTFDPTSSLQRRNDPDALHNFRTPRFDLDSLYGGGPIDEPFLYEADGVRFRVQPIYDGELDLPRVPDPGPARRRALIGDPRNDENVIVSQLHLAFLRFHNAVAETIDGPPAERFARAQRIVRWHYQWLVVHDFLARVVGEDVIHDILREERFIVSTSSEPARAVTRLSPHLCFFGWRNQPFMPVEFAGAAFRFGHSMVRPAYVLNGQLLQLMGRPVPVFAPDDGTGGEALDLRGFRERPPGWTIEWERFFEIGVADSARPLQWARRIDPTLAEGLSHLPTVEADSPRSLAERNLKRGRALGLPSGQAVARAMGLPRDLILDADAMGLTGELADWFGAETPLWYYVLAEAKVHQQGERLGPVGGRIVAEVLLGLLAADPHSYLRLAPGWTPEPGCYGAEQEGGHPVFGMPQLLRFAGVIESPWGGGMSASSSGNGQNSWSLADWQGERRESAVSASTYQQNKIANFAFPPEVWKSFTEIGGEHKTKYIFLERRLINATNIIEMRKREGAMLYIVDHPTGGARVNLDFERKEGGYCTIYRASTNQEQDLSNDELKPDETFYLYPGDVLFVCNLEYRLGCGDPQGITVLMSGIDLGGDCIGRPCP